MNNHSREPGPEAKFVALYQATYGDLLRFAQRRVPHPQAEDATAEAFLVAWRRSGDVPDDPDDARAWLFGIVRNVLLNSHRGLQRQRALSVRLATISPGADGDATDLVAQQVDLVAGWRQLSAIHQEALALAALDGLTAPQAAAVLGISAVAFRLRLSRARRALRTLLDHRATPARTPERQLP